MMTIETWDEYLTDTTTRNLENSLYSVSIEDLREIWIWYKSELTKNN
jgi:hypothetical protein